MTRDYREDVFCIENHQGHPIYCVHSYTGENRPLIVVPPQFEGTVRSNMLPMVYLINGGFNVLRFDFTFHQGNSYGDFKHFTLSGACNDVEAVIDFVYERRLGNFSGLGVLGISIASRILLRYLARHPNEVNVFLSLFGVVDMSRTILQIMDIDTNDLLRNPDHVFGVDKVLHHVIDGDNFVRDLVYKGFNSLEETKADINAMRTPTFLMVAEKDKWVSMEDYHYAYGENQAILRKSFCIPNAGHELHKNVKAAKAASRTMATCFCEFFGDEDKRYLEQPSPALHQVGCLDKRFDIDATPEPTLTELIELNTRERERDAEPGA